MTNIEHFGEFKPEGKSKKKKQIILCNTLREAGEYLTSLKYRYYGKYNRIPNYLITREGKIIELLGDTEYSKFHSNTNVDKNAITIVLENLGWLERKPLTQLYINWIGSIYKGKVYEKKWRDYFFWEPYTEEQIKSCATLCKELIKNHSIDKKCIGHNTKIDGIEKYEGIISRSNFDTMYTDLSPAFQFDTFIEQLENE